MKKCNCLNWARLNMKLFTEHHPNCSKYDPETDAKMIIEALLKGIEIWASDEDGVHEKCWKAYKEAKIFTNQNVYLKYKL